MASPSVASLLLAVTEELRRLAWLVVDAEPRRLNSRAGRLLQHWSADSFGSLGTENVAARAALQMSGQ